MHSVHTSIVLPKQPEQIWKVLTNVKQFSAWMPLISSLEIVTKGDAGMGAIWHVTKSTEIGLQEIDQEIIVWQKNKQVGWHDLRSFLDHRAMTQVTDMNTIFTLHQMPEGTLVELDATWEPVGIPGKFFSSLYYRQYTKKRFEQTLANLSATA